MCNNCIHKPVCSKFAATGGHVRECKHFKEERRGRWITWQEVFPDRIFAAFKRKPNTFCSYCGALGSSQSFCSNCGADMRGENK